MLPAPGARLGAGGPPRRRLILGKVRSLEAGGHPQRQGARQRHPARHLLGPQRLHAAHGGVVLRVEGLHDHLLDVPVDGKKNPAIAQIIKQAFTYVFNRETGEPIWPIVERPVPQTDVPGERTSPTQPFPTKPAPFDQQGFTKDDVIDFTP